MNLPSIETYGKYGNGNYGVHCMRVTVGPLSVSYSYTTPVAFAIGGRRFVRENSWGPTTGRHLNAIDGGDKPTRLDSAAFEAAWNEHVAPLLMQTA